jgi:hypothetical protein
MYEYYIYLQKLRQDVDRPGQTTVRPKHVHGSRETLPTAHKPFERVRYRKTTLRGTQDCH